MNEYITDFKVCGFGRKGSNHNAIHVLLLAHVSIHIATTKWECLFGKQNVHTKTCLCIRMPIFVSFVFPNRDVSRIVLVPMMDEVVLSTQMSNSLRKLHKKASVSIGELIKVSKRVFDDEELFTVMDDLEQAIKPYIPVECPTPVRGHS